MSEPKACRTCDKPITHKGRECYRCCAMKKATPKPCAYCGDTFLAHPKYGMTYCGNSCRMRREMPSPSTPLNWAQCDLCEAWFIRRHKTLTCSTSCHRLRTAIRAAEAQGNTRRGTPITRPCRWCTTEFTQLSRTRLKDFCSRPCRAAHTKATADPETRRQAKRRRRNRLRSAHAEPYRTVDIYKRDGWRCHLCGKPTQRTKVVPHPRAPTLDHIIPLARGGADAPSNVACAHFICNARKGDRPADEQLRLIG